MQVKEVLCVIPALPQMPPSYPHLCMSDLTRDVGALMWSTLPRHPGVC